MTTLKKSYPVEIVAESATRVRALVSVYDNVDYQGDRVLPGAFTKSLERWRASGDPIPVIFSHDWGNPLMYVGTADPAFITDDGPGLTVEVDWDTDEYSRKVTQLVHDRRVKEWSFAYDIVEERAASDGANELVEVSLIEVGPTLKGANSETQTLAAKMFAEFERPANHARAGSRKACGCNELQLCKTHHLELDARRRRHGKLANRAINARIDDAVAAAYVGPGLSGKDEIARYKAKLHELSLKRVNLERPGARAPEFDPNTFVVLGEEVPMPVSDGEIVRVEQGMTEPNTWRVEKETTGR